MNVIRTLTAAIAAFGLGAAGYGLAHQQGTHAASTPQAAAGGPVHSGGAHTAAGQAQGSGSADHSGHGAGQRVAHGMGQGMGRGMGQGMGHGMGHGMGQGTGSNHGADHGSGMGMGMGMGMTRLQPDAGSQADLALVHTMVHGFQSVTRTVTDLPDGIRTLTESTDPQVASALQAHVGSMMQRLEQGKEFNLFSDTIPVLFKNRERIVTRFEVTERGAMVVQTSTDPVVVKALQSHAREVSELAKEGPVAMQRNMQREMARNGGGAGRMSGAGATTAQGHTH
jgi:hypothetical protein